jgi:hypothetical protein
MHVEREHPPEAAGDPEVVAAISSEVRCLLGDALTDLRARRKRIFWGSIFDSDAEAVSR